MSKGSLIPKCSGTRRRLYRAHHRRDVIGKQMREFLIFTEGLILEHTTSNLVAGLIRNEKSYRREERRT